MHSAAPRRWFDGHAEVQDVRRSAPDGTVPEVHDEEGSPEKGSGGRETGSEAECPSGWKARTKSEGPWGMSDGTVHALPGFSVPNNEPVQRIVEILQEALTLAKRGEIVGVAISAVYRQPLAFGNNFHAEQSSRHTVAAGVLALGYQIAREMVEE